MSDRRQSVCTGILVDVSGSMKGTVQRPTTGQSESWSRSIFRTVDDVITNDVGPANQTFAIAFGSSKTLQIFDLLSTLRNLPPPLPSHVVGQSTYNIVFDVVEDLEQNGAPYIRSWADVYAITSTITRSQATTLLRLISDVNFKHRFVHECLPEKCRHSDSIFDGVRAWTVRNVFTGTQHDAIKQAVDEGIDLAFDVFTSPPSVSSLFSVQKARDILKKHKKKEKLTDSEIDELTETVESFIYGGTPMIAALGHATQLLQFSTCDKRLLFLLSDGYPTDGEYFPVTNGTYMVCCYITSQHIADPKRLYSKKCDNWDAGAKFLFKLSSTIATDTIPLDVFQKRNWKVDTSNNATKLFFQVNNPDLIQEVCDFAKELVCEEGKLPELLSDIKEHASAKRPAEGLAEQVRDQGELNTCYAHAIANAVQHNTSNVQHREGGYLDVEDIELDLIADYGDDGAYTAQVLEEICPRYFLQCSDAPISEAQAKEAIVDRRAVVARFEYTAKQRHAFEEFFDQFPLGILDKANLPDNVGKQFGHAVVLVGFDAHALKFLNSWGYNFADAGFFRIRNSQVLGRMQFYDVSAKLTASEKLAKVNEGRKWARSAMTLTTAQKATFRCPLCDVTSLVCAFSGTLRNVTCPCCRDSFDPKHHDCCDIVLTTYLTSLACTV